MTVEESTQNLNLKLCECGFCNEYIPKINKLGKPAKFKHGHNTKLRLGENHPMWKGGIMLDQNGYILVMRKNHPFADRDGYVKEHRLIYEEYHKCCLLPWIDIHHKNHIRDDNRIENLQPITKSEHGRIHNIGKFKDRSNIICYICKSKDTYHNKYNNRPCWFSYKKQKDKLICSRCRGFLYKHGFVKDWH